MRKILKVLLVITLLVTIAANAIKITDPEPDDSVIGIYSIVV